MSQHKSPLRYPGGKQKLAPFIHEVMTQNGLLGCHYAEPYAGGSGVAIELLLDGRASHIHLNDSCKVVYSFWRSVLLDTEELCRRISRASMTIAEWRRQREIVRNPHKFSRLDIGFSMFYLNRCNRSGILSGGVIGGLQQIGEWKMDARFPRNELIGRVESIALRKRDITVTNLDAEIFIAERVPKLPRKSLIYFDPPYFHKAERLYLNHYSPSDHLRIAEVIQGRVKRPWLVSYDDTPQIRKYYSDRRRFSYSLQYNARKVYRGRELFIMADRLKLPGESKIKSIDSALKSMARRRERCG